MSREGAFVLQNLLLLGVVAVVMWGTVLPLVSGMLGAQRVAGAPFYERAAGPLLAVILALLVVGPLLPWRPAGRPTLLALRWPAAAAVLSLLLLLIGGVRSLPALVAFPLAAAAGADPLQFRLQLIGDARKIPDFTNPKENKPLDTARLKGVLQVANLLLRLLVLAL